MLQKNILFPKLDDVYHFDKYDTKASLGLHIWCWLQMVALLLFISYLFANIAQIGNPGFFYLWRIHFYFRVCVDGTYGSSYLVYFWEFVKSSPPDLYYLLF
jgi:hypothetical protein